ncbi:MAG: hypothetical protein ACLU5I_07245 [Alistipes finegoldii]
MTEKVYTRHTDIPAASVSLPGRLSGKETDVHRRKAVKGMLPAPVWAPPCSKPEGIRRLGHPHAAQNPKTIKLNEIK